MAILSSEGRTLKELAEIFQRKKSAIESRLKKHSLKYVGLETKELHENKKVQSCCSEKDTTEGVGLELERTTIEMVCLANSRKLSERCVAGKILGHGFSGVWVRPVSSRSTGELSRSEINFQQGISPQLLDIISLQLVNPVSHPYQSENWLNDAKTSWKKVGELPVEKLAELCDDPNSLWVNGYHSYNGVNDRFPVEMADDLLGGSLRLVKPEKPVLWVGQELHGKIKVRCRFSCNGETYSLVVTDPVVEAKYLAMENGDYPLTSNNACLCVSIGEPHQGFCYKLVAGVIGPEV